MFTFVYFQVILIPDNPLSDISHDKEEYFMVGTIPVPFHKNTTKNSLHNLMSSCDHLPSPATITVSEQSKFKRKIRVDLGRPAGNENKSSESSFCSSFDDNNSIISTAKTLTVTKKFKSHYNVSPQQRQFWKDGAASADRPYNNWQRKTNFDICFRGKINSALTKATPLEKNNENCIGFETQDGNTNEAILRPGMVLLKHHLTHEEQVLDFLCFNIYLLHVCWI